MASKGSKAATGAASGAAAGTAIMPGWGTAIGAVVGGLGGYLSGDDPTAPRPVDLPPPQLPGGVVGQYGGWTIDPVTGRAVFYDNTANGGMTAENYRAMQLKDAMLGGNSAGSDLAAQIAQAQQLVDRLKGQGPGAATGPKASDFLPKEWVGEDGKPKTPGEIDYNSEMSSRSALFKTFEAQVAGKGYGKGSTLDQFRAWVKDAYRNNIEAKATQYANALKTSSGNQQTVGQGLDAAQLRLQTLMDIQKNGGSAADVANNPILNFLNQRNMQPGDPGYEARFKDKYADPNIAKMQGEADLYLDKSHQNINFDDLARQLGLGADPGIPDAKKFNADLMAKYSGRMGGERMAPIGAYDSSKLGGWLSAQDRIAQNQSASQIRSADNLAAKRGLLGSSINDSSKLDAQMALQDMLVGNAAKTYSMDAADRNNWFNQKFAIDQHNSDVAKTGAQATASLAQSGFGNELAAKQMFEQMMGSRLNMNSSEQQRAFQNLLAALNQRTALDQRSIDNTRYDVNREQGLDQQNFANRMGLLGYLDASKGQNFNQTMGQNQMAMGQYQLGANVGLTTTGWNNDYNIANAAQQNAYNSGLFQQQQAQSAQMANNWNTLAAALGQGAAQWGGGGTPDARQGDYRGYDFGYSAGQGNGLGTMAIPGASGARTTPDYSAPQTTTAFSMFQPTQPSAPTYSLAKPPTYTGR